MARPSFVESSLLLKMISGLLPEMIFAAFVQGQFGVTFASILGALTLILV
jgi:hypothetical protein